MPVNYLTVSVRTSGHTWGTTQWVPFDGQWSRLDSAIEFARAAVSGNRMLFDYRIYDTDGVIYPTSH